MTDAVASLPGFLRPTVFLRGRERSVFRLCGYAGFVAALATCAATLAARGEPAWGAVVLGATGAAVFLVLAMAVKVVTGRESLTYYHHEIAILAACGLVLPVAGLPVRAGLDAACLGLGAFLACGRVGCLAVGCCHGRPARWGVLYGRKHADAGFPAELVGVRLVPVQGIEALVAAGITIGGLAAAAAGARPGLPLVLSVTGYGLARFLLEEIRGDSGRPRFKGFSEAQWTSLVLVALAAAGAPSHRWLPVVAVTAIALAMLAQAVRRRVPAGLRAQRASRADTCGGGLFRTRWPGESRPGRGPGGAGRRRALHSRRSA